MNKKIKIVLCIILALLIVSIGFGVYYVNDYYHAESSIAHYLEGNENVTVEKINNGYYLDGPGNDSALIFYPGAKVEYTAYMPLLMNLSNNGVDCFLVEMPFNIAFFGKDRADEIISNDSYRHDNWYISGHSLGGTVASDYASCNSNRLKGIILVASYPNSNITTPILMVYGTNDNVLNKKNLKESKGYIKGELDEIIINGANHAQFGFYGKQDKDGIAGISQDEQINQTANYMLEFINRTSA